MNEFKNLAEAVAYRWECDDRTPEEKAETNTYEWAMKLSREGYKPYERVRIMGFDAELISYPYPSSKCLEVLVREPGDPTTIVPYLIERHILRAIEPKGAAL